MWLAFLAAVLFAASAVCGQTLSRQLGGVKANCFRITIACTLLGIWTFTQFPDHLHWATFRWLFLSGVLGFGLGDVALYLAYPLVGARTAVLVNLCIATLCSAIADKIFLGTQLHPNEIASAALTLTGVVLALHKKDEPLQLNIGIALTLFAGTCQGLGLTLSRYSHQVMEQQQLTISGPAQAFQRTMGGVVVGWIAFAILLSALKGRQIVPVSARTARLRWWLLGASFFGPVAGVSAMQVALQQVGKSAVVSAITSTAPLLLLPFSKYLDREPPTLKAVFGSLLAVAGLAGLAWMRM
jgi:drug/metabolite transporter (DMT)-like permease